MPESVQLPLKGTITNQSQLERQVANIAKKAGRNLKVDLGTSAKDIKSLEQPLGRITGQADEFGKSMQAANARVIAFGASVGIINAVVQSFKSLVSTTIEVEASLAKINSILNTTVSGLDTLKGQIFDIARNTQQTFDTVANAALELSRQGLGATEVTKRLNDALILSRLAGIDAADAVAGLTAAVNSFSKEGLTTGEVLNKISNAANQFAVSERDLIEGFKRSASVAQQAGVSIDELGGIITAVQQKTARGGAVIGNSFKTIFTRIGRAQNLELLESLGVQITDVSGKILPATKLIENLAGKLEDLNDVQVRSITEKIGGGFQIAPLLAALSDYSSETSIAIKATEAFRVATDEAYRKNIILNETLSAAITRTSLTIKELANNLGELGVTDTFKELLNIVNNFASKVNEILEGESQGAKFAKGILSGLSGSLIKGGLAIFGVLLFQLSKQLLKFGVDSFKTFLGLNKEAEKLKNIQSQIVQTLLGDKSIRETILRIERSSLSAEEKRLQQADLFNKALAERIRITSSLNTISGSIAPNIITPGRGRTSRGASGYLPVGAEQADISRGVGGAPKSAKPVVIPNFAFGGGQKGTMVANDSEYIVPNFAGGGSAIFNQDMVKKMGLPTGAKKINAAGGYMPNFARGGLGVYDSDFLTGKDKASVLNTVLTSGKMINVLVAPAGAGKTSAVSKRGGQIIKSQDEAKMFAKYLVLSAAGRTKAGGFSAGFQKIAGAAKTSGGRIEYLYVQNQEIRNRRNKRLTEGALDPRSKRALIGTTKAPTNQFDFIQGLKQTYGGQIVRSSDGYIPNFAQAINSKGKYVMLTGDRNRSNPAKKAYRQKDGKFNVTPKPGAEEIRVPIYSLTDNTKAKDISEFTDKLGTYAYKTALAQARSLSDGQMPSPVKQSEIKKNLNKGSVGSFAGTIYELSLAALLTDEEFLKYSAASDTANFDLSLKNQSRLTKLYGIQGSPSFGEVKGTQNADSVSSTAAKIYRVLVGGQVAQKSNIAGKTISKDDAVRIGLVDKSFRRGGYKIKDADLDRINKSGFNLKTRGKFVSIGAANGYIPNYAVSALDQAVQREKEAGVPVNQIRINQDGKLRNSQNPEGLAVTNTRDEPTGRIPNYANRGRLSQTLKPETVTANTEAAAKRLETALNKNAGAADRSTKSTQGNAVAVEQSRDGYLKATGLFYLAQGAMAGFTAKAEGASKTLGEFVTAIGQAVTVSYALKTLGAPIGITPTGGRGKRGSAAFARQVGRADAGSFLGRSRDRLKAGRATGGFGGNFLKFLGKAGLMLGRFAGPLGLAVTLFPVFNAAVKKITGGFDILQGVLDGLKGLGRFFNFVDEPAEAAAKALNKLNESSVEAALQLDKSTSTTDDAIKSLEASLKGFDIDESGKKKELSTGEIINKALKGPEGKRSGSAIGADISLVSLLSKEDKEALAKAPQDVQKFVNAQLAKLTKSDRAARQKTINEEDRLRGGIAEAEDKKDLEKAKQLREELKAQLNIRKQIEDKIRDANKEDEKAKKIQQEGKRILAEVANIRIKSTIAQQQALAAIKSEEQFILEIRKASSETNVFDDALIDDRLANLQREKDLRKEISSIFTNTVLSNPSVQNSLSPDATKKLDAEIYKNINEFVLQTNSALLEGADLEGKLADFVKIRLQAVDGIGENAQKIVEVMQSEITAATKLSLIAKASNDLESAKLKILQAQTAEERTRERLLEKSFQRERQKRSDQLEDRQLALDLARQKFETSVAGRKNTSSAVKARSAFDAEQVQIDIATQRETETNSFRDSLRGLLKENSDVLPFEDRLRFSKNIEAAPNLSGLGDIQLALEQRIERIPEELRAAAKAQKDEANALINTLNQTLTEGLNKEFGTPVDLFGKNVNRFGEYVDRVLKETLTKENKELTERLADPERKEKLENLKTEESGLKREIEELTKGIRKLGDPESTIAKITPKFEALKPLLELFKGVRGGQTNPQSKKRDDALEAAGFKRGPAGVDRVRDLYALGQDIINEAKEDLGKLSTLSAKREEAEKQLTAVAQRRKTAEDEQVQTLKTITENNRTIAEATARITNEVSSSTGGGKPKTETAASQAAKSATQTRIQQDQDTAAASKEVDKAAVKTTQSFTSLEKVASLLTNAFKQLLNNPIVLDPYSQINEFMRNNPLQPLPEGMYPQYIDPNIPETPPQFRAPFLPSAQPSGGDLLPPKGSIKTPGTTGTAGTKGKESDADRTNRRLLEKAQQQELIQKLKANAALKEFGASVKTLASLIRSQFENIPEQKAQNLFDIKTSADTGSLESALIDQLRIGVLESGEGSQEDRIRQANELVLAEKTKLEILKAQDTATKVQLEYEYEITLQILALRQEIEAATLAKDPEKKAQLLREIAELERRKNDPDIGTLIRKQGKSPQEAARELRETFVQGASDFVDTLSDGMVDAISKGESLRDVLREAATSFVEDFAKTSLNNLLRQVVFGQGQSGFPGLLGGIFGKKNSDGGGQSGGGLSGGGNIITSLLGSILPGVGGGAATTGGGTLMNTSRGLSKESPLYVQSASGEGLPTGGGEGEEGIGGIDAKTALLKLGGAVLGTDLSALGSLTGGSKGPQGTQGNPVFVSVVNGGGGGGGLGGGGGGISGIVGNIPVVGKFLGPLLGAVGFNQGGSVAGRVKGGSGVRDDVPAVLMAGEYVIKKSSVQKYGSGLMESINSGNLSKFADGGLVNTKESKSPVGALSKPINDYMSYRMGMNSRDRTQSGVLASDWTPKASKSLEDEDGKTFEQEDRTESGVVASRWTVAAGISQAREAERKNRVRIRTESGLESSDWTPKADVIKEAKVEKEDRTVRTESGVVASELTPKATYLDARKEFLDNELRSDSGLFASRWTDSSNYAKKETEKFEKSNELRNESGLKSSDWTPKADVIRDKKPERKAERDRTESGVFASEKTPKASYAEARKEFEDKELRSMSGLFTSRWIDASNYAKEETKKFEKENKLRTESGVGSSDWTPKADAIREKQPEKTPQGDRTESGLFASGAIPKASYKEARKKFENEELRSVSGLYASRWIDAKTYAKEETKKFEEENKLRTQSGVKSSDWTPKADVIKEEARQRKAERDRTASGLFASDATPEAGVSKIYRPEERLKNKELRSDSGNFVSRWVDRLAFALEKKQAVDESIKFRAESGVVASEATPKANLQRSFDPKLGGVLDDRVSDLKISNKQKKEGVPSLLTDGEFVMSKKATDSFGTNFLDALNKGAVKKFSGGGFVAGSQYVEGERTKKKADTFGTTFLDALKKGNIRNFANGGLIPGSTFAREEEDFKTTDIFGNPIKQGSLQRQRGSGTFGGDFFIPGLYGQGRIEGAGELLDFATQGFTSGSRDVISSGGGMASIIALEPESVRLTNFGRMRQTPLQLATQEAKGQAFSLDQQYKKELQDYKKLLDELEKQEKERKKQLLTQLAISVVSMGLGAAAAGIGAAGTAGGTTSFSAANVSANGGWWSSAMGGFTNPTSGVQMGGLTNWSGPGSYYSQIGGFNIGRQGYAAGGYVQGRSSDIDSVSAMLSGGEFVLNRAATERIGQDNLQNLNSGGSTQDSEKVVNKLEEILVATRDNSGEINITVNGAGGGGGSSAPSSSEGSGTSTVEKKGQQGDQKYREELAKAIKLKVLEVLREERRLGGTLR